MHFLPKILAALLLAFSFSLFALLSVPPVQAYTSNQTLEDFQKTIADQSKYNKQSFDFESLTGTMASLTSLLIGCVIQGPDGQIDYNSCPPAFKTGAISMMGTAIAGIITNPPASGVAYLADVGQRLNLVKPAYAQTGFGFNAINPFLGAWRAVRNFAYLVFVLAAVIMGVTVMLRVHISPQVVITIQSAIPRLIIGLIFITFSYAIVGLLIDFIYVAFGLLVFGLSTFGFTGYTPQDAWNTYRTAGFGDVVSFVFTDGMIAIKDLLVGTSLPF